MPITRLSDAQIVKSYTTGSVLSERGWDMTRLTRLEDGRLALVWGTDISGTTQALNIATVDALGQAPTAATVIDSVASSKYLEQPKIAATAGGGFLAVWNTDTDTVASPTSGDAFGRSFSATGTAAGSKVALSAESGGGEYTPSITRLQNGNLLSIWSDTRTTSGLATSTDILGRITSPSGAALSGEFVVNTATVGQQFGTDLTALGDGRAVAIWATGSVSLSGIQATGIKGRFVSAAGAATGAEFAIDEIAPGRSYETKTLDVLSLGSGGFVAVWEEDSGAVEEIHFQRFSAAGTKAGPETIVEAVSGDRHILHFFTTELANGGFAVGWRLTAGGLPESHHLRQFTMTGAEIDSEAALDTLAGAAGLTKIHDMELMADGHVMLAGFRGTGAVATQVLDLGNEALSGSAAADTLYGKNGVNDLIIGGAGADRLYALSGHDKIRGGLGNDNLSGGAGRDAFVFDTALDAATNTDRIGDFVAIDDAIQIDNAVFAALGAATGTLAAAKFYASATGTAHDADDRILYNATTGVLSYDADGNGAAAAVQFAVLTTKPVITAADFVVI